MPTTKDGKLLPASIQRYDYDGTFWCEVTVGKVPHRSRLLIYISSTLNEESALHAKVNKKGTTGDGAMSILEDFTVVSIYWKGLTRKAPWTVEAPRRIFSLISELLEISAGQGLPGVLMCCEKPDIWGYSRGAMSVMSFVRQIAPFAGPCFRSATLIAPYFAKTWRSTRTYPFLFDKLLECPVRIVVGESDSWFREAHIVINAFVQYHRSKSHLAQEAFGTNLFAEV